MEDITAQFLISEWQISTERQTYLIFYFHRCPATFLHYSRHSKPVVLRIYKRTSPDLAFTERRKQSLSRDLGREYALKLSSKTVVYTWEKPFCGVNSRKQLKGCYTWLNLSMIFGCILTPSCERIKPNTVKEVKGKSYENVILHNTVQFSQKHFLLCCLPSRLVPNKYEI